MNRQHFTRRRRSLVVAATVVGLLMASCSNSGDDDEGSNTTAPPQTTAATETTAGSETTAGTETTTGTETTVDLSTFVPLPDVAGVTDDEIRFSAFGTNSNNPLGTCVLDCYADGINAYFAWRNSEGGLWGRQLVLSDVIDDELTNNQARALEIISANDTFATFSATQFASGWGDLAAANIPLYVWSIHPAEMTGRQSVFGTNGVTCTNCTSRGPALVAQLAGATKVAALGYGISENSKVCAQSAAKSIDAYSAELGGAKAVYVNDSLAFGLPNGIGPEVTAMKDAGVDLILSCLDLNAMKTIAQELDRQGYNAQVTMYHPNTYNQDFVAEADGLFDGDYVGVGFRPFEADAAGSNLESYQQWMDETGSELTELAMVGWLNADLAFQGLVAAGPEFDRQKVIDATNSFTAYSAGGLLNPIDWSRQHEGPTVDDPATHGYAQECIALVKIVDGAFEVVSDAAAPWYCWPGGNRDWSDPVATNFESTLYV